MTSALIIAGNVGALLRSEIGFACRPPYGFCRPSDFVWGNPPFTRVCYFSNARHSPERQHRDRIGLSHESLGRRSPPAITAYEKSWATNFSRTVAATVAASSVSQRFLPFRSPMHLPPPQLSQTTLISKRSLHPPPSRLFHKSSDFGRPLSTQCVHVTFHSPLQLLIAANVALDIRKDRRTT